MFGVACAIPYVYMHGDPRVTLAKDSKALSEAALTQGLPLTWYFVDHAKLWGLLMICG